MWPSILGPGWGWAVLVALAFLCLVLGVLGFLLLVIKPPRDADESTDRPWPLLEERNITAGEFERRKRALQPKLGARGVTK